MHRASLSMMAAATTAIPAFGVTPQITVEYGYEFVSIGDVGNAPVTPELVAGLNSRQEGRGSVGYEYRMARTEVSTTQWVDFMNAVAGTHPQWVRDNLEPFTMGGGRDATWPGPGERWIAAPGYEKAMVGGISWRAAAMYCNWLHNNQATSMDALMSGAYNASTFSTNPDGTFNDQLTHSPGARFWIPTLDEWMKAVHYDPDRHGAGQGGWWLYPHGTDTAPVSGWPDEPGSETSAGTGLRVDEEGIPYAYAWWDVPLGSYSQSQTPWGLLDASGMSAEWLEEAAIEPETHWSRFSGGAFVSQDLTRLFSDRLGGFGPGGGPADTPPFNGLRLAASSIPSPPSAGIVCALLLYCKGRRLLEQCHESTDCDWDHALDDQRCKRRYGYSRYPQLGRWRSL